MEFISAHPNEVIDRLRWQSLDGAWEIGLRQMLFGVRVSLSRIGDEVYTLDYCAGVDLLFAATLLATICKILERYPESIAPEQLQRDFPGYTVRPIDRDPYCWSRLQAMAAQEVVQ